MTKRRSRLFYLGGAIAFAVVFLLYAGLRIRRDHATDVQRRARLAQQRLGPAVAVIAAKPAPRTRQLTVPAEVQAYQQVVLYAKVAGYLGELRVDRGDRVRRGDLLGVVTTPETDRQLSPLQGNLTKLKAIAARVRALVPGVETQQDLDRADADVQAAQSEVDRLISVRGFQAITAPFDGVVTTRYVNVGAMIPAATGATQAAQPVIELADTSRVRVIAYLGQRDATQIRDGDTVSIVRDNDPLHPTVATVTRISRTLDPRTRTMPVEIDVENTHDLFYPGVFVAVTLSVPAPEGVIIPSDAILLTEGKPSVALVEGTRIHLVPVRVGDDDGKLARVLSGVKVGEKVVAQVTDEVVQGATVQPREQGSGSGGGSRTRVGIGIGNGIGIGSAARGPL